MRSIEDVMEREANEFAMCLMMPEKLVRQWMRLHMPRGIDISEDDDLKTIAKAFNVSTMVAAIRLKKLGYFGRFA